jgi:type I restriction enzyme, S subunit
MKFVPLERIAQVQLGKMLSPKSKTGVGSFPYLRNQNVQWQRFKLDDLATMDFSEREREKFRLLPGDLLVCEGGEPGRCAVWPGVIQDCYYQKALHRVRPNPGVADADFLAMWIRLQAMQGSFDDQSAKTTIAHLPLIRLLQLPVPDIAIGNQLQVVAELKGQLSQVDAATTTLAQQIREIDALTAAVYKESFEQTVPVAVPNIAGSAPSGWSWRKLVDIATLESGHTPSRSRADWWGGSISWVSLTEIRSLDGKWVESTQLTTNEAGIANSSARLLPRGTVCFSRTASVGFVTILGKPMSTSQDFANWICGAELDPEYLMYALIASRSELRAIATGATHKTIYMPELSSFVICSPTRTEQERIVLVLKEKLATINRLCEALKQQERDIRDLPRQVLARGFGKIHD